MHDTISAAEKAPRIGPSGAFTLLAVACLTIMVGCVIVPGLPSVAKGLGVPGAASWLVTLPSLGVVVLGPLAGKLIERIGSRNALCCGLALYGLLGGVGAFLHGTETVFANRFLLGGATAIVMAAGTGLISEFYTGHTRLTMIARQGMAIELGGVIFLFIGGLLASWGWRYPFVLYLMSWVFLAMVIAFVPAQRPRQSEPVGDGGVPTGAKVNDVYFAAVFSMIVFFVAIITLPARLHEMGATEVTTGDFLSFISLIAVVAAWAMPRVTHLIGARFTLVAAFVLYCIGHLLFAASSKVPTVVIGGLMLGCGFGLSVPLVNHMIVDRSEAHERPRNLAYLSVALFSGQFLSSFADLGPNQVATAFIIAAALAGFAANIISFTK